LKIKVLGIGNILRGDDGVGVYVVEHLRQHSRLRDTVEFVEIGMGGLDMVDVLKEADAAVIVDAIHTHDIPPGEARIFSENEIRLKFDPKPVSLHYASVADSLLLLEALGIRIPIHFVVVSPAKLDYQIELSPQVQSNFKRICEMVEELVEKIRTQFAAI